MDTRPINLCKQCIHYIPPSLFKKHHPHGKCSLFAHVSLVDGEIIHELAKDARRDLCKGKFYKEVNTILIKTTHETDDFKPGAL